MFDAFNSFKDWLNNNPQEKKDLPHWEEFFSFIQIFNSKFCSRETN